MSLQQLINQFVGNMPSTNQQVNDSSRENPLESIQSSIPGGLAGGIAAGGVMALLMGNKSARKLAGRAAAYGGTALLGGMAYKGYKNWQQNRSVDQISPVNSHDLEQSRNTIMPNADTDIPPLHLTMIKAMIAAAKSDGHIDANEQQHIFEAVEKMNLPNDEKATVFDCMTRDISVHELAASVTSIDHKAEVYLSSFLAIDPDHPKERKYLEDLASALKLPEGLADHLENQALAGFES